MNTLRVLKTFFTILIIGITGSVLLMEITPGHFQRGCACCKTTIVYSTPMLCKPCDETCYPPLYTPFQKILLQLSLFDLTY